MENFAQCLKAWMKSEKTSASALSERLQYKSKTTVLRILQEKSNGESCRRLYERLAPCLDEAWQLRFQNALGLERLGVLRAGMVSAIHGQLFPDGAGVADPPRIQIPELEGGRLIVLGDPEMPDELLTRNEAVQAVHFMTDEELLNAPSLLSGVIRRLACGQYEAYMLPREKLRGRRFTWNTVFYLPDDGKEPLWLLRGEELAAWYPMPGGADEVCRIEEALRALAPVALYRYSKLTSGSDMMRFTQEAYRLERNRKAVIIKPTPGMQMLPEAIVENAFKDYLARNSEPLTTAQGTLIATFEKRVDNFWQRKKPTSLFFSAQAMLSFVQTGTLTDQFFALRPFTVEERIKCLKSLMNFVQRDGVTAVMQDGRIWPVSMEIYACGGVLLYPSKTSYNTNRGAYRELLLPGRAFTELFAAYTDAFLFHQERNNEQFIAECRRLMNMAAALMRR